MMNTSSKPAMVVGTSSCRRRMIVEKHFGEAYTLIFVSPDIDEKMYRSNDPHTLTRLVAEAKMQAVMDKVQNQPEWRTCCEHPHSVVLTFDQVVVWEDEIREKPVSEVECRRFLKSYSNSRVSTVQTTVRRWYSSGIQSYRHNGTTTFYRDVPDDIINGVIMRGDCFHTAGAFVVEDAEMSTRVVRVDPGNVEEVQGISIRAINELLQGE